MTTDDDKLQEDLTHLLARSRRRPAVIKRDEQQLEYETLEDTQHIVETDRGKYVIHDFTVRVTTRHLVVREFDPELSYQDAIHHFIGKDENLDDTDTDE